jgi:hypothetical protein
MVLLAALLTTAVACAQQRQAQLQEASANFDIEDVKPFLARVVALIDSGFTTADARALAERIAQQPIDSEREYRYTVLADGAHTELHIVAFMDDVDAPDIAFLTHAKLAAKIDAAMQQYFDEVGK